MSSILVETKSNKKTKLAIRPFIPEAPPIEDIGLWEHGEVLMPGSKQIDQIACLEGANGVKRYVTGLNELAPEILNIADEKERKAKVREIRKDIIHLEKHLASNAIPEDEKTLNLPTAEFMKLVMVVRPDNDKFWDSRTLFLQLTNTSLFLDIENPYDYIKLRAIEAGGYDLVAPSYSDAKKKGKYKWHLDRYEKTVADKTAISKLKNKAIAELQKLSDTDNERLRYVLKALLIDCSGYKPSTPNDALYEDADAYINGRGEERSVKKASENFISMAEKNIEYLKLLSIVKDASIYNFLVTKGSTGKIHHAKSDSILGANIEECVEYLKNPLHEKVLEEVQKSVEAEWVK